MKHIVFYDGHCPMCNSWVRRLLRWDRRGRFVFAALEGETARQRLAPVMPEYLEEDTIILLDQGRVFLRSDAVLQILCVLGFPASLGCIGKIIPKAWRDGLYKVIAARRYSIGPRYAECPLPPPGFAGRFLP